MAPETVATASVRGIPALNGLDDASVTTDAGATETETASAKQSMNVTSLSTEAKPESNETAAAEAPTTKVPTDPPSADLASTDSTVTSTAATVLETAPGVSSGPVVAAVAEERRRNFSDEFGFETSSLGSFDPPSSLEDKLRSNSIMSGPSTTSVSTFNNNNNNKNTAVGQAPISSSSSSLLLSSSPSPIGRQENRDEGLTVVVVEKNAATSSSATQDGDGDGDVDVDATSRSGKMPLNLDASISDDLPSLDANGTSGAAFLSTSATAATSKPIPIVAPAPSVLLSQADGGRRPLRKRKGSVDFSFALDDNDSNTSRRKRLNSTNSTDFYHSMDALPPIGALPDIDVLGDIAKDDLPLNAEGEMSSASGAPAAAASTAIPPPPLSPLGSQSLVAASTIPKNAGRTRSRTNSSAGMGSATTETVESLLSIGSSSSKGSGNGDPDRKQNMAPPAAPMKDMTKNQRIRKDSFSSHGGRARKNSHINSTTGSNSARRRMRAYSEDNFSQGSTSHDTFTSQSHRFLLEAFMGDGTESLVLDPEQRERLGSFDGVSGVGESAGSGIGTSLPKSEADESIHPGAVASSAGVSGSAAAGVARLDNNNLNHHNVRDRLTSFDYGRRERLESWGGMSDLSGHGLHDHHSDTLGSGNQSATAAALAATIYTSLANDVSAAAGDDTGSVSSFLVSDERIPTRISVNRDRLNSIASVATDPSALLHGMGGVHLSSIVDPDFPSEMQRYVRAAMASVGDQLADIAASAEAGAGFSFKDSKDHQDDSEISSAASPMIGDLGSKSGSLTGRPRSSSVSSLLNIAVDYDAVAAAVDAAEAAAGAMDLTNLTSTVSASASSRGGRRKRKALPLRRKDATPNSLTSISELNGNDRDLEEIRAEARAVAGYVPPGDASHTLPPKKRAKMYKESPDQVRSSGTAAPTPIISNKTSSSNNKQSNGSSGSGGGQASQKWDSMLEALKEYAQEREEEETKHLTEEQKAYWSWDGNVPTMYKTKDGKALGRWVNNQRSAKSKGTLKEERENRLVAAGLKWTVQASSSWNEMLEELKLYIDEQAKTGKEWDGNVPTNYCIKLTKNPCEDDEKNLGRWVNRQRSMYQAGKLRKDRQLALEAVGLKWSVLTSITWESMFDTLCEYVEEKKESNGRPWDGNVPATYKTVNDDPPRALGRWINRQRSAYSKNKLKEEYVEKLNSIGLRWSIHDRKGKKAPPGTTSSNASLTNDESNDDPEESGSVELVSPDNAVSGPSPAEGGLDDSADIENVEDDDPDCAEV